MNKYVSKKQLEKGKGEEKGKSVLDTIETQSEKMVRKYSNSRFFSGFDV